MNKTANLEFNASQNTLVLKGVCTLATLSQLDNQWFAIKNQNNLIKDIDASQVDAMDTAGARWLQSILAQQSASIKGLNKNSQSLLSLVEKYNLETNFVTKPKVSLLEKIGIATIALGKNILSALEFIGELFINILQNIIHPTTFRFKYFFSTLQTTGFNALPIVGFLAFLIGVVITYQTGLQLLQYGANIFIISLLGIAVFREFAPLITAIIIAGRTGSAFTAQLGLMQSNQEIDALRTMGFSPMSMLVLPRFFGLLIAMPLLTVWADIFGIFGGMVMSKNILNISYMDFINQFPENVTLTSFMIGLIKAPVYAMIISIVGCHRGFKVSGSSESIGAETTRSVVTAIFLIIMADAAFSVVLSWLNI